MTLHTYTPKPMSLPSNNFLHLTVAKIKPRQDFIGQGHYGKVKGPIKVTPSCCTPTTLNQCPYQVTTLYTLRFPRYSPDKIFIGQSHCSKVTGQIKVRLCQVPIMASTTKDHSDSRH